MDKVKNLMNAQAQNDLKIKFTYIITAFSAFLVLLFLVIYIIWVKSTVVTIVTSIIFFWISSAFIFLAKKKYNAGKTILISGFFIQLTCIVFFWFPVEANFGYFYFLVAPISFFIYDFDLINERIALIVINAIAIISLILSEILVTSPIVALEPSVSKLLTIMSIISTVGSEIIVFYFYASTLSKTHKELKVLANTDSLTNILNRRVLFEQGALLFDVCKAYNKRFSLVILDIDYFKKVNDMYGHPVGDSILIQMTEFISSHIRKEDIFCRYGGEEFALILKNVPSNHIGIVEKIKSDIETHEFIVNKNKSIHLTVSIGVVTCANNFSSFESLVQAADQLLYEAKNAGRNTIVTY